MKTLSPAKKILLQIAAIEKFYDSLPRGEKAKFRQELRILKAELKAYIDMV